MSWQRKASVKRWRPGLVNIGVIVVLLAAVTFLPPDTSLRDVERAGVLRVCVPDANPPLVTGDAAAPGFDVEILQEVAQDLGVRLLLNVNSSIGRDFNPLNWRLTRANCSVIAGGVSDTRATRGFLQTLPTGIATGWMLLSTEGAAPEQNSTVGVLPAGAGFNRLELSRFLRSKDVRPRVLQTPDQAARALRSGEISAVIGSRFVLQNMQEEIPEATLRWMPEPPFEHHDLALGLCKGDLTLLRAFRRSMERMEREGTLRAIGENYGISSVNAAPVDW